MIGTSQLHVVLGIPAWVREGLANGTLAAWGGTIRDRQGHIRALLTEGRGLADLVGRGIPLDPSLLTDAIGHAQTAATLASGIGLLNLGVSVAGFAMVRQQLNEIADQLQNALAALAEIKEDVGWIRGFQMARVRGNIDTALDVAIRANRLGDRALFIDARSRAFETRRVLHHALSDMLTARRMLNHPEVFLGFVHASAVLAIAEARCDEAVEGPAQAGHSLRGALHDLRRHVDEFDLQRRDFAHDPATKIRLGSRGRGQVAAHAAEMADALRQMEGAAGPLALRAALGLTTERWRELTAPEGSGLVTCLMPPPGVEADLTEWIREGPETRPR